MGSGGPSKQGTLANYNDQNRIMMWVESYFVIDGQGVVKGTTVKDNPHQNDHIIFTLLGEATEVRHPFNKQQDRGITSRLSKTLHDKRTHNRDLKLLTFDLTTLTQPIQRLFRPTQKADEALWSREEHKLAILREGRTPDYLVKTYNMGHHHEMGRMSCDIEENKFSFKQATAFLEPLLISIVHSIVHDTYTILC